MKKAYILALVAIFIPSIAFGATFSRNLSLGTTGTDVSQLQQFLADEGLYNGPVTGTFGSLTQKAVIAFQLQENISPATGYFGNLTRTDANSVISAHPEWTTAISNNSYYKNVNGNSVHSPAYSPAIPAGASAQCGDGTYSYSLHRSGTCSHHSGVSQWLQ